MQTDNMNGRSHYNPFVESWKRKNREIAERVNKKNIAVGETWIWKNLKTF